jgi:general secretion pathway protein A
LLQSVCDEFGIAVPAPGAASVKPYIDLLNAHLLVAHGQGRHCVLIIDEAQNLSAEVLEQLRLLTNLETNERKLLQIILIGQPELRSMLAGPGLEQLAQRVIARYHLGALSAAETAAYVAHRLAVAGRQGGLPFDAAALRRIHAVSGGVPRRINLLADRALLGAYAGGLAMVGRRGVDQAAREVFDDAGVQPARQRWQWLAAAAVVVAVAVIAALVLGAGLLARRSGGGAASGLRGGASAVAAASAALAAPPGSAAAASMAQAASGAASASAATLARPGASAAASSPAPSAAALAPLPGLSTAAASTDPPPLATDAGLSVFTRDEPAAWRELATLWGVDAAALTDDAPCAALRTRQLRCHRGSGGTLALLRQLDRPAWLLLHGDDGQAHLARLVSLDDRRAVLAAGAQRFSLPMPQLARWWRGEFNTLWRSPDAYADPLPPGARGAAVDALARGLAALRQEPAPPAGQVLSGPLAERLAAFQVAQSLRPDGIAGPTTFMQLNRAQGVAEPRLGPSPSER